MVVLKAAPDEYYVCLGVVWLEVDLLHDGARVIEVVPEGDRIEYMTAVIEGMDRVEHPPQLVTNAVREWTRIGRG
jgi:hypothetical protein